MREMLTEWMLWLRRRGAPPSRRAMVTGLLLGGILLGALILLFSRSADDSFPVTHSPAVAPSASGEAISALRAGAGDADVWSTRSQRARKWQVAKMEALSRLLTAFPAVAEATVLLEPGREAKFGRPGAAATAAVHLVLAPGAAMTPDLLRAVIDQTAGGVSELSPQAVRVIDSAGRSYTLGDVQTLPADPREFRRAERQFREKIQAALTYVPGLAVVVEAEVKDGKSLCRWARLSLPHSYAETIYRRSGAVGGGPRDLVLNEIMRSEAGRIRTLAAAVTAAPAERVTVDWHYDASPLEKAESPHVDTAGHVVWKVIFVGGFVCAEAGLVAGVVFRRVRRRRRRLAWVRVRAIGRRRRVRTSAPSRNAPDADFDAILQAGLDDLVTLLSAEEPQTIAWVLSRLSPARAGKVLGRLSAAKQAETARQIAELREADPEMLRQAERRLAHRWTNRQPRETLGGAAAVASILQHTGQAGRKNVLEALQHRQPDLAERISRRLLSFEDVSGMDPELLAGALGSLSGEELALALWTADETVRPSWIAALSPEQREAMERAAEQMGPVRLSQVVSAQQHIVDVVREFEAGRLAWTAAGREEQTA
ncbi:MAG: hypothetical protein JW849_07200 [Phycisphaerae bacterium]|nr:hypothetical protein [Phycisphaerae bacterium]